MTIRAEFIDAMAGLVSSVNIVTTDGVAGRAGATVSAMTSVSADGDAPTILVCLHFETSAAPAIMENGCFCVNLLSHDQTDIANVFAGRTPPPDGDKFTCAAFSTLATGAPALTDALAVFDCDLVSDELIGTHHVMIGKVRRVQKNNGVPLLYGNRSYQALDPAT